MSDVFPQHSGVVLGIHRFTWLLCQQVGATLDGKKPMQAWACTGLGREHVTEIFLSSDQLEELKQKFAHNYARLRCGVIAPSFKLSR